MLPLAAFCKSEGSPWVAGAVRRVPGRRVQRSKIAELVEHEQRMIALQP